MSDLKQRPGDQPLPTPNGRPDIQSMVIADIAARREVGISRYGSALQAFNHRDGLRDAYEEAMDLTVYLRQILEERNVIPAVLRLLAAQEAMLQRWAAASDQEQQEQQELWQALHVAAQAVRDTIAGAPEPPVTPEQETAWSAAGERMADAYELGIKATALHEFAVQIDAGPAEIAVLPAVIAELAREKAAELDHQANALADDAATEAGRG